MKDIRVVISNLIKCLYVWISTFLLRRDHTWIEYTPCTKKSNLNNLKGKKITNYVCIPVQSHLPTSPSSSGRMCTELLPPTGCLPSVSLPSSRVVI